MPLLHECARELSPRRCRLSSDKIRIECTACCMVFLHRAQDFTDAFIGKMRERNQR